MTHSVGQLQPSSNTEPRSGYRDPYAMFNKKSFFSILTPMMDYLSVWRHNQIKIIQNFTNVQ